jgi:hypothetical protein
MTSQPGPRLNAAFYADSVAAFLRASDDKVYAPLASPHGYTLAPEQLSAWRLQLPVLRAALKKGTQLFSEKSCVPFSWQYLKNAYRVLLTRARQGMVIFVPPGAKRDKTRSPGFYGGVSEYLADLGVPQV